MIIDWPPMWLAKEGFDDTYMMDQSRFRNNRDLFTDEEIRGYNKDMGS